MHALAIYRIQKLVITVSSSSDNDGVISAYAADLNSPIAYGLGRNVLQTVVQKVREGAKHYVPPNSKVGASAPGPLLLRPWWDATRGDSSDMW